MHTFTISIVLVLSFLSVATEGSPYERCQTWLVTDGGRTHGGLACANTDMESIPEKPPKHAEHFTMLYFQQNAIQSIAPGTFRSYVNLKFLNIGRNRISSFPVGIFNGINKLDTLWADHNPVSLLKKGLFANLGMLKKLDLVGCRIANIELGALDGLKNLRFLRLRGNRLTTFTSNTFEKLVNLARLELDRNRLNKITTGTFRGLINVTYLGLGRNKLVNISKGSFRRLKKLRVLELDRQRSKYISFPLQAFRRFLNKEHGPRAYIDLSNNYIKCDCTMDWLVQIINYGMLLDGTQIPSLNQTKHLEDIKCVGWPLITDKGRVEKLINRCRKDVPMTCELPR